MVEGDILFSNLLGFKKVFLSVPEGNYITIDVSKATMVDHTSIVTINALIDNYKETGGKVLVIGFENHRQLSKDPTSTRILKLS